MLLAWNWMGKYWLRSNEDVGCRDREIVCYSGSHFDNTELLKRLLRANSVDICLCNARSMYIVTDV